MKLPVLSRIRCLQRFVVLAAAMFLAASLGSGQCHCTCSPSPPGGTTHCEKGQIAICSGTANGTCSGSCISYREYEAHPDRFAAAVFSKLLKQDISTEDMQLGRATFKPIFDQLSKSFEEQSAEDASRSFKIEKMTPLEYKDHKYRFSVGSTDEATGLLREARRSLFPEY